MRVHEVLLQLVRESYEVCRSHLALGQRHVDRQLHHIAGNRTIDPLEYLADETLLIMFNLTIRKSRFAHVRSADCNEISDFTLDVTLLSDVPGYKTTL